MSSRAPTFMENAAAQWASFKPVLFGLGVGLIVGPIVSGMAGFQVRTSTANAATRAGVVEQQALFCVASARGAAHANAERMDWTRSYDLARAHAIMPGATAVDSEVALACARKLSE